MVDRTEYDHNRRHTHNHVKMCDYEHCVRKRDIDDHVPEE